MSEEKNSKEAKVPSPSERDLEIHKDEYIEKASKYIQISDPEGIQILKTQLLTEYYINSLLAYSFPVSEAYLFSGNMRFADKLKKLKEEGLLDLNEIEAIKRLNNLRNKFSHDIDYKVSEGDLDYIGFCFGKEYLQEKYKIHKDGKIKPFRDRLLSLLLEVCICAAYALAERVSKEKLG